MIRTIQLALQSQIQSILLAKYDGTLAQLVVEQPPNIALGELALPVAFELAKRLRKAPRAIATELAAELNALIASDPTALAGVASVEVAGAGYLNIRLDRAAAVRAIARDEHANIGGAGFRLIEHTSINPNKAAHIGHLRNAILGDTFQCLLRPDRYKRGYTVGVQNYKLPMSSSASCIWSIRRSIALAHCWLRCANAESASISIAGIYTRA
jgi:arginyl-tRNA synthetase